MGKKSGGVRIKQVGKPANALTAPLAPPTLEDFMIPPEEMIHLPPPPNKKYQIFFPLHETFTMKTETFQMIYPSYVDATKTIQQGRRLPLHILHPPPSDGDDALPPLSPTVQELSQALQSLGIRHVLQPYKGYSRDAATSHLGRCWVDVSPYANKRALLRAVAQRLTELPERQRRMQEHAEEKRKEEEAAAAKEQREAQAVVVAPVASTSGNSKKKGNKKKK